ncbi:MAG: nitroreductase [Solobacterium sp.]|nr:nitroreductase [Solobacterium sp.]
MDLKEAMQVRHSVRSYLDQPIEAAIVAQLREEVEQANEESGLHLQLVINEPKAFQGGLAHYGSFSGVTDYLALVGPKGKQLEEACGYYGERIVLKAQTLGLNSCWVGLTFKKIPGAFQVRNGEKLAAVIALGYGVTSGIAHKSKSVEEVSNVTIHSPDWFRNGVNAALNAPTAVNQQKFRLELQKDRVQATAGLGFFSRMDLGIIKLHFELGSGKGNDIWI